MFRKEVERLHLGSIEREMEDIRCNSRTTTVLFGIVTFLLQLEPNINGNNLMTIAATTKEDNTRSELAKHAEPPNHRRNHNRQPITPKQQEPDRRKKHPCSKARHVTTPKPPTELRNTPKTFKLRRTNTPTVNHVGKNRRQEQLLNH
ncbi:hypothetical protein L195_g033475 [Trifolium pratense]|uniref:Uncharacterized protein n=1 Tax=Trifolium pratense TaxID=57577 RepID=A0A2K3LG52_TRIPR|nr:hypothetical protein L195_g033475 [Trifolium pratense]